MLITKPKSSSEQFIVVCIHLSEWWPNLFFIIIKEECGEMAEHDFFY